MPTIVYCDYLNGVDADRTQAYTNDPAAGSGVVLEMADTSRFIVGASVIVSSSAGSEAATVTVVDPNVSITVASLALNHTTSSPLVTLIRGTNISPYKTITQASTGLTGGDEVRCAKSPDPATLAGTLTFTDASASVATSSNLTAVLSAKDFVSLNTAGETWWEISSINSTTITLVSAYCGTGGVGTGYKRGITGSVAGVTDTGAAAAGSTVVQAISASGSAGSLIKISGGWNLLGIPGQDGQTFFFQSATSKNGYGIQLDTKHHIDLDCTRIGMLRYNRSIYLTYSYSNSITSPVCSGNSSGIYISASYSNTITSPTCNGNSNSIYLNSSYSNTITSPTCNGNSNSGIYLLSSHSNVITSPTCNGNENYGIYFSSSWQHVVYNYAHDESTWSSAGKINNWIGNNQKLISINESQSGGAARNRVYFYGGYTQDNAIDADGGTGKCLQFNPKSATYWIEQDFVVPVTAASARTIALKMKDDVTFNGSVFLELWYMGTLIVGPTEKTMTTSYVSQEMTATSGQIAVDGVLTLKVKVYGTDGAVYADTLSYS